MCKLNTLIKKGVGKLILKTFVLIQKSDLNIKLVFIFTLNMYSMKLNLNSMTAVFASNSGSDTSEECHPCGRVGEGSGGRAWVDGWLSVGD